MFAWQGQYFFIVLIQLTILYPWIRRWSLKVKDLRLWFAFTCILYAFVSYFELNVPFPVKGEAPFFYWLFYLALGIFLARHLDRIYGFLEKHLSSRLMFGVVSLVPFLMLLESLFVQKTYARFSVLLSAIGVITIALKMFSYRNAHLSIPSNIRRYIDALSKYSLGIFCINSILTTLLISIAFHIAPPVSQLETAHIPTAVMLTAITLCLRLIVAILSCVLAVQICRSFDRIGLGTLVK